MGKKHPFWHFFTISYIDLPKMFQISHYIPARSRGFFGFGPVRGRHQKLFGLRRLETTILKGLFSYLVYTFAGLGSRQKPPKLSIFSYFLYCNILPHTFICFICVE
jgi:hypothetical protein